ncbi:MAG: hypothetical protein LBF97_02855 [Elusimicrobiota bacterium]|nr:hypothetical protein [Elusimicrobiota bacterium]
MGDVVIFQQNNATNGFNPTTLGTITKISDSTVTTTTITPPKYVLQIYDVQVSSAGIK